MSSDLRGGSTRHFLIWLCSPVHLSSLSSSLIYNWSEINLFWPTVTPPTQVISSDCFVFPALSRYVCLFVLCRHQQDINMFLALTLTPNIHTVGSRGHFEVFTNWNYNWNTSYQPDLRQHSYWLSFSHSWTEREKTSLMNKSHNAMVVLCVMCWFLCEDVFMIWNGMVYE